MRGPVAGIVVGMLIGNHRADEFDTFRIALCRMAGKRRESVHIRQLLFHAPLHGRLDFLRRIEGADGERHAVGRFIGQRRAALRAEAALDMVGRAEPLRRAADL